MTATTTDRIHQDLLALQTELQRLHGYTSDIGTAKTAASEVIEASSRFVKVFEGRVGDIVGAMTGAGTAFSEQCRLAAKALSESGATFESDTRTTRARFVAELEARTAEVAATMAQAAADFAKRCEQSRGALEQAGHAFRSEMAAAQASLLELKRLLGTTAEDVHAMLAELRALDLGRSIEALQPVITREGRTTRRWLIGAMALNLVGIVLLLALR
jgi:hypothetical protein